MITEQDNLSPDEVMGSLRRVALFEGLPDDDLRALVEILKGINAGPGDLLFEEGDEDDRFFVVTAGAVEIVKRVPGGGGPFTVEPAQYGGRRSGGEGSTSHQGGAGGGPG